MQGCGSATRSRTNRYVAQGANPQTPQRARGARGRSRRMRDRLLGRRSSRSRYTAHGPRPTETRRTSARVATTATDWTCTAALPQRRSERRGLPAGRGRLRRAPLVRSRRPWVGSRYSRRKIPRTTPSRPSSSPGITLANIRPLSGPRTSCISRSVPSAWGGPRAAARRARAGRSAVEPHPWTRTSRLSLPPLGDAPGCMGNRTGSGQRGARPRPLRARRGAGTGAFRSRSARCSTRRLRRGRRSRSP